MSKLNFTKFSEIESWRKDNNLTQKRVREIIGAKENRYAKLALGRGILTKDEMIDYVLRLNNFLESEK